MLRKKIFLIILISVALIIVIASLINPIRLLMMQKYFISAIRSYKNLEILDSVSTYGKLNGNGNGIQFFGAVLITGNQKDIEIVVASLSTKFEVVDYSPQSNATVNSKHLEHRTLEFDETLLETGIDCYMVYYYSTSIVFSNFLDLVGY